MISDDSNTAATRRPSVEVRLDERGNLAHDRAKPWADTVRMQDECQLDRLLWGGQISDAQWRAGVLFRSRWIAAHASASYGIRYGECVDGGGWASESDRRLWAQGEIRGALDGVPTAPALAVQGVCGGDEPARGRLDPLRLGLDHLARHYGVPDAFKRRAGM